MLNQISKDMINLIGISGKKGSGKDTVGKIIQYLTSKHLAGYTYPSSMQTFNEFIINGHRIRSDWQIKKFADPLKDIVCILTGCTREQLEDEAFKNSKLPDEWKDFDEIPIINGDSYVGTQIIERHFTYRELLQYVGTDLFRNQLHEDVFNNAVFSKYKHIPNNSFGNRQPDDLDDMIYNYPKWIITDVRFPNGVEAIEKRGGVVIRVDRPCQECGMMNGHKMIAHKIKDSIHSSETALDNHDFKYTIDNNGSIDDLIVSVDNLLKTLKLK